MSAHSDVVHKNSHDEIQKKLREYLLRPDLQYIKPFMRKDNSLLYPAAIYLSQNPKENEAFHDRLRTLDLAMEKGHLQRRIEGFGSHCPLTIFVKNQAGVEKLEKSLVDLLDKLSKAPQTKVEADNTQYTPPKNTTIPRVIVAAVAAGSGSAAGAAPVSIQTPSPATKIYNANSSKAYREGRRRRNK